MSGEDQWPALIDRRYKFLRPFVCFADKSLQLRSRAEATARKAQLDSGTFAD